MDNETGMSCLHCNGDLTPGWEYYKDQEAPDHLHCGYCSLECAEEQWMDAEEQVCDMMDNIYLHSALTQMELADEFYDALDDLEQRLYWPSHTWQ